MRQIESLIQLEMTTVPLTFLIVTRDSTRKSIGTEARAVVIAQAHFRAVGTEPVALALASDR